MNDNYLEAWNEYISLENEFKNIILHIPLVEEHLKVWSLKIGDILIVLGSVIDSFLKLSIKDKALDGAVNIKEIRKQKELNMAHYREVFDNFYNLSSKYVYVRHMEKRIQPFANWSNGRGLKWWNAYQNVKHDRFANKKEATVENLLYGLAGLFLLYIIHLPSRKVTARLKLWKDYHGGGWADSFFETMIVVKEPLPQPHVFFSETDLFGYILEGQAGETKLENTWHKLLKLLKEPLF